MNDDSLFEIINPSSEPCLAKKAHIQGNLIQKKQSIPTLAGTHIYNVDNLAPPLDPVNFNVFGRLFGVSFITDDVTYIRSISPFEYVRCYQ